MHFNGVYAKNKQTINNCYLFLSICIVFGRKFRNYDKKSEKEKRNYFL